MSDKQNDGCRFQLITFLLRRDKSASYCCCKPFKLAKNLAMLKCSREVINVSIVQQQIAPDNWYQSILLISLPCNGCYTSCCSPASSPWLLQPFLHTQAPLQASPLASPISCEAFQPLTNPALLLVFWTLTPAGIRKGQHSPHTTFWLYFC